MFKTCQFNIFSYNNKTNSKFGNVYLTIPLIREENHSSVTPVCVVDMLECVMVGIREIIGVKVYVFKFL